VDDEAGRIPAEDPVKTASAATLAILAAGQYYKAELYTIAIPGGGTYRFTTAQTPTVVAGSTYGTGLTIQRSSVRQKAGLEVQSFSLTIIPQLDSPNAPILIEGVPLLQAVLRGILDSARITMAKIFLTSWADTTPGLVPWAQGRVNQVSAGRFSALISVNDDTELLNVPMPRNLIQPGCVHTLYDAGCGLSRATFAVTGTVSGTPSVLTFNTNLTQVNKYFDLGVLTFTSGVNNGLSFVVKTYVNASGNITCVRPMPSAPAAGNTFSIVPACLKSQAACSNASSAAGPAFNNLAHFRGYPYVPVPETLYDGNTQTGQSTTLGNQGGSGAGSNFSGGTSGTYQP
jgi:uncharacterized phage protein (TIGR02218 family)